MKAGLDKKGKRAARAAGSSSGPTTTQSRSKRLRKAIDVDSDDEEGVGGDADDPIDLDDDDEMAEAAPEVGENGLIGKTLRIKDGAQRRVGKVVAFDARSQCHTVVYEDTGEEATVDLQDEDVVWNMHSARAVPGASGRAVESSDEEDLLFGAIAVQDKKPAARKAAGAAEGVKAAARPAKRASASQRDWPKPASQKKKKRGGGSDGEEEEEEEEERDLSIYQHHDPVQIKQLQQLKKKLFRKLYRLKMPDNPLDTLINELGGPDQVSTNCPCVLCVGPLCGPPLRWWVLCGVLPSMWIPCGWGPPLSCSRFPWHLFLVLPLARAHALAVECDSTRVGISALIGNQNVFGSNLY